jgi:7-keto-8-aminopelargonate synthetase-like enzyme
VTAGRKSLELLQNHPERVTAVQKNAQFIRRLLSKVPGVELSGTCNHQATAMPLLVPIANVCCVCITCTAAAAAAAVISGDERAPFVHMRLDEDHASKRRIDTERTLQAIVEAARKEGVALTRAKYVHTTKLLPAPSIRVCVSCDHTEEQMTKAVDVIHKVVSQVLNI